MMDKPSPSERTVVCEDNLGTSPATQVGGQRHGAGVTEVS